VPDNSTSPDATLPPGPAPEATKVTASHGLGFAGQFFYLLATSLTLGLAAGGGIAVLLHRFKRHGPHHVSADLAIGCLQKACQNLFQGPKLHKSFTY
jgi:hypothetical protein